jgi:hypothetical protein
MQTKALQTFLAEGSESLSVRLTDEGCPESDVETARTARHRTSLILLASVS